MVPQVISLLSVLLRIAFVGHLNAHGHGDDGRLTNRGVRLRLPDTFLLRPKTRLRPGALGTDFPEWHDLLKAVLGQLGEFITTVEMYWQSLLGTRFIANGIGAELMTLQDRVAMIDLGGRRIDAQKKSPPGR